MAELTKRLVDRAMEVELTDHVGYEPPQEPPVWFASELMTQMRVLISPHVLGFRLD